VSLWCFGTPKCIGEQNCCRGKIKSEELCGKEEANCKRKQKLLINTNTLFQHYFRRRAKASWNMRRKARNRSSRTSGVQDDCEFFYTQILFIQYDHFQLFLRQVSKDCIASKFPRINKKGFCPLLNAELRELQKQNTPIEIAYLQEWTQLPYYRSLLSFSELRKSIAESNSISLKRWYYN